ncbi:helix-turn-helix transcriptional regulator [Laspinema palackyanum]|uniref:helix-turn-helix transcriptional regulator n=1 Tax=Laspinema palackyanum TaxID=3231601 RepID=UPI00349F3E65
MSLRARVDLTQEELATELSRRFLMIGSNRKVTKKSVSDWETGRHSPRFTPPETLEVCDTLKCDLVELALAVKSSPSK